jgi:hypothetical protein
MARGLYISPPHHRPHGFWYIIGPHGIAVGDGFFQAYMRYVLLGI